MWHNSAFPGKAAELPLNEMDIKAFCVSLAEAGFSFTRIVNIFRGLCMWVSRRKCCCNCGIKTILNDRANLLKLYDFFLSSP